MTALLQTVFKYKSKPKVKNSGDYLLNSKFFPVVVKSLMQCIVPDMRTLLDCLCRGLL